jgi:hypothetical protein
VRIGLAERFRFHAMIIAGIGSGYTRFSGRRGSRKFSNLLANILISVEPWTRDRPLDLGAWTRDLGLGTLDSGPGRGGTASRGSSRNWGSSPTSLQLCKSDTDTQAPWKFLT